MASLETLELEIKASSGMAVKSLTELGTTLAALQKIVGNTANSLMLLNTELLKLRENGAKVKIPKVFGGGSGGSGGSASKIKQQTSAIKEQVELVRAYAGKGMTDALGNTIPEGSPMMVPKSWIGRDGIRATKEMAQEVKEQAAAVAEVQEQAEKVQESASGSRAYRRTESTANRTIENANALSQLKTEAQQTSDAVQTSAQGIGNAMSDTASQTQSATTQVTNNMSGMKNAIKAITGEMKATVKETSHSIMGFVHQVGRIAKTMMIRGALRALFKAAKQGMDNYYEYSKTVANGYSATVDTLKNSAGVAGNQLGAALTAMVGAAAPALMTLLGIVTQLAEALTMLFAVLGGKTTYSKAKEGFGEVASSAGGASAKIKEVLADFDELNVIASESGGGGGGGGGGNFGDMFEEAEIPQWMMDWGWAIGLGAALLALLPIISKLIGLFQKLKDLFNWFPKFRPEIDLPNPDNYNPFPKQPEYKPFPIQPEYHEFPAEPDYKNALVQMLAISAAIKATEANMDMLNRKAQLFAITMASIKDKTVKVKLDTRAFEPKRRDVDDWTHRIDEKNIRVELDEYNYIPRKERIDSWSHSTDTKHIRVDVDMNRFNGAVNEVRRWTNETPVKKINISFPTWSDFINRANIVNKWVSEKATKYIDIVFRNWSEFKTRVNEIDAWVSKHVYKQVTVVINFVAGSLPNLNDLMPEELAKMKMPTFGGNQGYNPNGKSFYNTSGQGDGGIHGTSATYSYNTGRSANAPMGVMLNSILGDLLPESWLKADGGLISNGDLFIANERGAELVGSFGNSTGVANNDQIIAGIQRGVSDANQEQNALLRQQNELLRDILNKDSSVRINASAAFGRVASQSIAMYGNLTGG